MTKKKQISVPLTLHDVHVSSTDAEWIHVERTSIVDVYLSQKEVDKLIQMLTEHRASAYYMVSPFGLRITGRMVL